MKITKSRRAAIFCASSALAVCAVAAVGGLNTSTPKPSVPSDLVLANYTPTADKDSITYLDEEYPTDEPVASIASTEDGVVVTSGPPDSATVSVYDDENVVREFDHVRGISLVNHEGTVAAWVETRNGSDGQENTVVAVDAGTGEVLGRTAVGPRTQVMAVVDRTIAWSDSDTSHLWQLGAAPQQIAYVPDDYYIVGLTVDQIIASDLNGVTQVYDRASGALASELTGLASWALSPDGQHLGGASTDGTALVLDLSSGKTTPIESHVDAGSVRFTPDGTIVVTGVGAMTGTEDDARVAICEDQQHCVEVEAEGLPYLPNESLSQLLSQAS